MTAVYGMGESKLRVVPHGSYQMPTFELSAVSAMPGGTVGSMGIMIAIGFQLGLSGKALSFTVGVEVCWLVGEDGETVGSLLTGSTIIGSLRFPVPADNQAKTETNITSTSTIARMEFAFMLSLNGFFSISP